VRSIRKALLAPCILEGVDRIVASLELMYP
jgi:hypothetical protein